MHQILEETSGVEVVPLDDDERMELHSLRKRYEYLKSQHGSYVELMAEAAAEDSAESSQSSDDDDHVDDLAPYQPLPPYTRKQR